MKLLAKQKEGKKRMVSLGIEVILEVVTVSALQRTIGNVELSQEAFHSIIMKK